MPPAWPTDRPGRPELPAIAAAEVLDQADAGELADGRSLFFPCS
jgi:hypothetical protein